MFKEFDEAGIRFKYPTNWQLEREDNEAGWTLSLYSPGTSFMLICLREDAPAPEEMADQALEAMREEYPELESEDCVGQFAGQPAIGHEIHFFSMDLTNTCMTRCFYTAGGTMLVMWQSNDLEPELNEQVLRAICASMELVD